jgi:hypothetical protein
VIFDLLSECQMIVTPPQIRYGHMKAATGAFNNNDYMHWFVCPINFRSARTEVFAKSYLPFLPFTLITQFVKR